jgi:hypothetical protein
MSYSLKRGNFPRIIHEKSELSRIILRKQMLFCRINCGKPKLTSDYTAERNDFPQYNLQKVLTFCRLYCGKAFCRLYCGKACLSAE